MSNDSIHLGVRDFATTRWSIVLAAHGGDSQARTALEELCARYWYPLYAFVRRQGHAPHDAQDLTQEFFARLIGRGWLAEVAQERGRFRSWLLAAMRHFLTNEWNRAHRQKRGGGAELVPLDAEIAESRYAKEPGAGAEQLYDRRWALDILDRALARTEAEWAKAGKAHHFAALQFCLTGEKTPLAEVAARLSSTEGAVKVTIHRMRERYREHLRAEIAETVETPGQVDAEIAELLAALRG